MKEKKIITKRVTKDMLELIELDKQRPLIELEEGVDDVED